MDNILNSTKNILVIVFSFLLFAGCKPDETEHTLLLKNTMVIDGTNSAPLEGTDILIIGDSIAKIGKGLNHDGAEIIDLTGKTVMPALISAHVHIGTLKGTTTNAGNYTRDNIIAQLKKYQDFGILNIMVMGTDRPLLFESGIRDSSVAGLLPGARAQSAGYGFAVQEGVPPNVSGMDLVFRPRSERDIPAQLDSLAAINTKIIKIWVDDFSGEKSSSNPALYKKTIGEAHKRNMRVATHLYSLEDSRQVIKNNVEIIAHSIRDSVIDDALIQEMKQKAVIYIPTLMLDEFAYVYANNPEWIDDPFFKASLEPGAWEMLTSEKYRQELKASAAYRKKEKDLEIALLNLKKLHDAGVLIAMGTDSGASPARAQGFSEHRELELMVKAGIPAADVIKIATINAARALKMDDKFGTISEGKIADLLVLDGDPLADIKNTRKISMVLKAGKIVKHK